MQHVKPNNKLEKFGYMQNQTPSLNHHQTTRACKTASQVLHDQLTQSSLAARVNSPARAQPGAAGGDGSSHSAQKP